MILDYIYGAARSNPTKPALIHNDVVISYAAFARTIDGFRKFFEQKNLSANTVAVVLVDHLADAWCTDLALRALGLTTIQLHSLAQVRGLGINNISCVVTTAREQLTHRLVGNPLPGASIIVVSRQDLAVAESAGLPLEPKGNHPPGGHILYTSGTTGAPKKLFWDGELEDLRCSARAAFYNYNNFSVVHVLDYELPTGIGWKDPLSVWRAGGGVVIDQRAERYERFFRNHVNRTIITTGAFRKLVEANQPNLAAPIRFDFQVGGGALGADLASRALAKFGSNVSLELTYSATEMITPALISRIGTPDDALWLCPGADRTIQIVDESGHECSFDQEGDLRILTTELDLRCYLDDVDATSKTFRDEFFYPGDRAVRRADGRIRILGRIADILNILGEKFAVGPFEQRIQQLLNVGEVCVFSGLNAAGQDELVIAIKSDREPAREKLDSVRREFRNFTVRCELQNFDKVRFTVLTEFPRTNAGTDKVHRAELRKIVFGDSGNS